jgi:hypothetical protein
MTIPPLSALGEGFYFRPGNQHTHGATQDRNHVQVVILFTEITRRVRIQTHNGFEWRGR